MPTLIRALLAILLLTSAANATADGATSAVLPSSRQLEAAMVHNARDLGERLKALQGAAGYTTRAQVFEGETHISVAWASVIPFLNFALAAQK